MIFRQLFDAVSSTYTYLLADAGVAVLVDPVFEHARRDATLLRELGLQLAWTLETHVHADHVTGAALLRRQTGCRIALSAASGATGADRLLLPGDRVAFGGRWLSVRATPGHTDGCVSYVLDDGAMAFTGDALLIRGCGRTDFQQGSAARLYDSVHAQLFTLPAHCLLYPAHDYRGLTVSSVAEERDHNPRLGGAVQQADFAGFMQHLGLPHPKQMDLAVPANLQCGQPQADAAAADDPHWAPLEYSFAGIWTIAPHALADVLARVELVDVREADEFDGPLGHIAGARLVPLASVATAIDARACTRPVVLVCRSGARSARAAALLQQAGVAHVAHLGGGMLRWRAERLPVVGGDAVPA